MAEGLEDLQDQLGVMEGITDQLKGCESKAERETVMNKQLLMQYIILEDRVLEDLPKLSQTASDSSNQEIILEISQKFNELGSEYQDTWDEDLWKLYESIRNGYSAHSNKKTSLDIRIDNAIDMALNRSLQDEEAFRDAGKQYLAFSKGTSQKEELQNPVAVQQCMCSVF